MRTAGGSLRRFTVPKAHGDRSRARLPDDHPAVVEARTRYPKAVFAPDAVPRLLVGGFNQAKIGAKVMKGPWAGMPIYTLTLEERKTCPASCPVWNECYGNSTPFARRIKHGRQFERMLERELLSLAVQHARFAVRVHILGDFYNYGYAQLWFDSMHKLHGLHIFGFTAHWRDGAVGQCIQQMNSLWPDRCAIRFSVSQPTGRPMEATTLWGGEQPDGVIPCPAQTGGTDCCATCGLCWAPAARHSAIGFVGHGGYKRS